MKLFTLPSLKETVHPVGRQHIYNLRKIDPFYFELFKGLRAKIEYKVDMVELRVLAVTSAVAGEGKTLTAINLAANMASTGRKKILLVDMDLRKSGISSEMGLASNTGLGDYLSKSIPKEEIVQGSPVAGLFVVSGGNPVSSPADMLAGDKFRSLIGYFREQFDLVILDTPPVLPVPDAITVSEQVDAFIFLFRLRHTPYKLLRQAVEELGDRKIMGVVLNGEEKKSDRYYSRYYGKYYKSADAENKPS